MFGLSYSIARTRAHDLLALLGLASASSTLIADYSKGMRKKLGIACALIHRPALLFFDEPFDGIDATSADTILRLFHGLLGRGTTILLTTHVLEVAEKVCQRIGIIDDGRLALEIDTAVLAQSAESLSDIFRRVVGHGHAPAQLPAWLTETRG
jgi:ABC-2 type transport system ATP-binding protein